MDSTTRAAKPGWPEIIAGAAVYALSYLVGPPIVVALTHDSPVSSGIGLAALSGIMGLLGFFAAFGLRLRAWPAFSVRAIPLRWVFIALGCGLLALVLTRVIGVLYVAISGSTAGDVQGDYQSATVAGGAPFALYLLGIAVLTPLGEEFLFRGVLATALTKYGSWVAVLGSAVVFALVHGINLALIPAVVVGVLNGVLLVRSESVWPGVIVHAVNNGLGAVLALLAGS
ncbi:type II CAAX endopeptidase family protein [Amycolatopsis sp. PS_44_ISF1]|uniref:CPBP family intramembrane glutamic endopeptidase n=1 Tax=Amycolatopsis sp. PS_44_ISF1 TaxID=2974917 RepID=UPI0028DD9A58|nr:type II CAAX endopeptidase family protein [Amycolatopsis sp. PS_44_ISF1]MDT8915452.1 CPBP family intramembrane metalloprotease [Amycolatopsis sp. PS_44_ISF1]